MKFLYIYLLTISLTTCNKTTTSDTNTNPTILGKWKWEQTSFQTRGMPSPKITTPETEGVDMTIDFRSDTQVKVLHNGKVVQTLSYTISGAGEERTFFKVSNPDNSISPTLESDGILRLSGDKLEIAGGYNDRGANQLFVRIK